MTGDFRMRIFGGLSQKNLVRCTLKLEIKQKNFYVCPYTVATRLISTLFMLPVNHHLGNSYVLYWTPYASLFNYTLKTNYEKAIV